MADMLQTEQKVKAPAYKRLLVSVKWQSSGDIFFHALSFRAIKEVNSE